jgi:hypothetical protein
MRGGWGMRRYPLVCTRNKFFYAVKSRLDLVSLTPRGFGLAVIIACGSAEQFPSNNLLLLGESDGCSLIEH